MFARTSNRKASLQSVQGAYVDNDIILMQLSRRCLNSLCQVHKFSYSIHQLSAMGPLWIKV